jgi:hypothetical protein
VKIDGLGIVGVDLDGPAGFFRFSKLLGDGNAERGEHFPRDVVSHIEHECFDEPAGDPLPLGVTFSNVAEVGTVEGKVYVF